MQIKRFLDIAVAIREIEGSASAMRFLNGLYETEKVMIADWIKQNIPALKDSPFTREANFEKALNILKQ